MRGGRGHRRRRGRASRPSTPATIHRELVEQFSPPTVLAKEGEIVHVSPRASRYLRYAAGEPSHALVQALPSDLRSALRIALGAGEPDRGPGSMPRPCGRRWRASRCGYDDGAAGAPPRLAGGDTAGVVRRVEGRGRVATASPAPDPALAHLEEELQRRNEQVRMTIEQYEASSEELKASNEELQAINEELRSATEELETSKEELQSTNEELITVNRS